MSPSTPTAYTVTQGSTNDSLLRERWEALRAQSPQNSPFSSSHFAAGLLEFAGFENTIFLVSRGNSDLAGTLIYSQKKGPFRVATVPPFTSFASLLTTVPLESVATSEAGTPFTLLLHKIQEYFDSILLHHHPSLKDIRLFKWSSWKATPLYTYHIDLTDADALEGGWSSSTRRTFKKHAEDHILEENSKDIEAVVQLAEDSYKRHGRDLPLPAESLQAFARQLTQAGMVRTFTLTPAHQDAPTAGVALLHDNEVAYYWLAGSVPGHSMTVLLGHLFPRLASEGIQLFDFVGANTPYIAEFKRRFGPTLVPYYATQCSPNNTFAFLQALKRRLT